VHELPAVPAIEPSVERPAAVRSPAGDQTANPFLDMLAQPFQKKGSDEFQHTFFEQIE